MSRHLVTLAIAFVAAAPLAASAQAQSSVPQKPGFELLIPSGTVAPTGGRTDDLKRGNLTAIQMSYGFRPDLALTGTFGWARTRATDGAQPKVDMLTYDIGAECRMPRLSTDRLVNFKPFVGAGIGGRSYNYRHPELATRYNLAAYVGAGGELAVGRVRVRLEVRNYMNGADRENDVAVLAGLRLGLR